MLQLFQSIFGSGRGDSSPYPADLIDRAIERTVDGTDSRLRAVSGYKKRLRTAVSHALDHVVALVDGLPPALELDSRSYGTEPEITAYFASVEHLREILERDAILNEWRRTAEGGLAERVVLLLLMTLHERKTLGVALEGETVRHDVAQTTVSFTNHTVVDPTRAEDQTRLLLKRRAFDHLLALALGRISTARAKRGELERERDLLRRKRAALASGRWGFDQAGADKPTDPRMLQQQLEDIESQLSARGAGPGLLEAHLDIVVEVLSHAESTFWCARRPLSVDRMGVKQTQASGQAPEISLSELHNAAGQSLVARVVSIESKALPAQRDLLRDAQRSLG
jgi:hypothetical protein